MRAFMLSFAAALAWPIAGAMELSTGLAQVSVPVTSMKTGRFASTLRQQYDFSCGSAALATLLTHHYATPVTEAAIFERMFLDGDQPTIRREGFSLLDMQRYLARRGFVADGFQLPLEKLIASSLPAIVLISEHGYNHFVVIKGARDGRVLVGDPSSGTRVMAQAQFKALWPNGLLFVIHGSAAKPVFNAAVDWRAAPLAPLASGVARTGLDTLTLPRNGPGDF